MDLSPRSCEHEVPWLEDITYVHGETAAHCQDDVLEEATVKAAASHLLGKYANLARDAFSHESLADHSRKFAVLWRALEAFTVEPFWRTKPKLHQMQELCEMLEHNPSLNWTYRDEDFGGVMAQLCMGSRRACHCEAGWPKCLDEVFCPT